MQPYTKNQQVFVCPDSSNVINWVGSGIEGEPGAGGSYSQYAMNESYAQNNANGCTGANAPDFRYTSPSSTIEDPWGCGGGEPNWRENLSQISSPSTTVYVLDCVTFEHNTMRPYLDLEKNDKLVYESSLGTGALAPWISYFGTDQANYPDLDLFDSTGTNKQWEAILGRHSGMVNMLYCDGHVKSQTFGAILNSLTNDGSNTYYKMFNATQ